MENLLKTFRVNDIFYSLQGEGRNAGRAAVFVRFSGCNRDCPFCDTDCSEWREMTIPDIVAEVSRYAARFVVLTGGEPTLQADEQFVDALHAEGFEVAMETNGSNPLPANLDWSTVSPKGKIAVDRCNELKVLFFDEQSPRPWESGALTADYYYLQPCDVGDASRNTEIMEACVEYIKAHPLWRLSLQTHKLAGFK